MRTNRYRTNLNIDSFVIVSIPIFVRYFIELGFRSISINIRHGQAEAGNLVFMEDGIEMDTSTGGGASSMFRR